MWPPNVWAPAIRKLRKRGLTVSADLGWNPNVLESRGLPALLGEFEFIFPNELEARAMTGEKTVEAAARKLARRARAVSYTHLDVYKRQSMPRPDSAIFTLSKAMAKLADYETPVELIPSTREFFETLAKTSEPPLSTYFQDLVTSTDPKMIQEADREISKNVLLLSLIHI